MLVAVMVKSFVVPGVMVSELLSKLKQFSLYWVGSTITLVTLPQSEQLIVTFFDEPSSIVVEAGVASQVIAETVLTEIKSMNKQIATQTLFIFHLLIQRLHILRT